MLIRAISLIAVIAVAFIAGRYSTTPEGQKIITDARAAIDAMLEGDQSTAVDETPGNEQSSEADTSQ